MFMLPDLLKNCAKNSKTHRQVQLEEVQNKSVYKPRQLNVSQKKNKKHKTNFPSLLTTEYYNQMLKK